jgi:cystathionine beta-lyase
MEKERNLNFDEIIDRRNTDSLKFDFAVRRGKPADILPLWVADMDFRTSSFVLRAIKERTEHGIFGYTEAGESYYEAVSEWMEKHHDLKVNREWVLVTPGVVFALAMAVKAYTEPGDAILIEQPVYYPISEVITDNGRKAVSSNLVLSRNGVYRMDFADIEEKIREHHIKLFILCSPHNPVGRVWTLEELKELADICVRNKVILLSDEIHEDFVYPGHTHHTILNVDERLKDYSVTCTSPSKTFNLAGLQISNIIIPNRDLRRRFRKQIDAAGFSQQNTLGLTACEAAYRHGEEWYQGVMEYLRANLSFLKQYLCLNFPEVNVIEPEGTYLVWLDLRKLGLSDRELEDRIVHTAKLWLDGGAIFGPTGAGFQRINIATGRSVLKEALDRLCRIRE